MSCSPSASAGAGRHQLAGRVGDPLRGDPTKGLGWQSDLAGCAGAVGPDVRVADLLAAGAFGPGFPESAPSRRADDMAATATRGAVRFPRRVAELLRAGLDLRDRHAAGEISRHGLAVARRRLENQMSDLILPPKTNAANERLSQHLWTHRAALFTFLRQPGLDATNWRAELAIRFGVILRKVWGGSRTWAGARAQSVLIRCGGRAGSKGVRP